MCTNSLHIFGIAKLDEGLKEYELQEVLEQAQRLGGDTWRKKISENSEIR